MVYKFVDKKSAGSGVNMHANNECRLNLATQKLPEELHKPIIKKVKKKEQFIQDLKTISGGADLADMQLINKFNKDLYFY